MVDKHLPDMRQNVLYVCSLIELTVVLPCKCHISKYHWIVHLKFYLFIFGCAESVALCGLSLLAASGGYSQDVAQVFLIAVASYCRGFFCCGAQALGHASFASCSSWA